MKKRYVPSARPYDDKGTMLHVIVLANNELVQPTISKTRKDMPMHPVTRALLIAIGIAACMCVFWLEGHL